MAPSRPQWQLRGRIRRLSSEPQHRAAYYLTLSNLMAAATGFLFWLLLARAGGLSTAALGVGFAIVALGTLVAVVAKGGLDTALLQKVPGATRKEGARLLAYAFLIGAGVALALIAMLATASRTGLPLPDMTLSGWILAALIALLLLLTWLEDAQFLALGHAQHSFERNVVLSMARLALPIPILALAIADPVPLIWALALAASAIAGAIRLWGMPERDGRQVPRREFLRSALRNLSGGAAEFMPGLLLAPLVLIVDGAEAAAYFGIAWTAAALVFQTSTAIGRGALAQMVQSGPLGQAAAIRKAVAQTFLVVAPLALAMAVGAPWLLAVFGSAFALEGASVLAILSASILFVAPASLYVALLRARDARVALVLFPALMVLALLVLAPLLAARYGIQGVAIAWLAANAPFGTYAAWRLHLAAREVTPHANASPLVRPLDAE